MHAESQSVCRADLPGAMHGHRQKVQRDVAQRLPHTRPAGISGCSKPCDTRSAAPFSSTPVHYPGASVNFDRRCRLYLLNNRNHSSFDAKQPTKAASHYLLVLRRLLLWRHEARCLRDSAQHVSENTTGAGTALQAFPIETLGMTIIQESTTPSQTFDLFPQVDKTRGTQKAEGKKSQVRRRLTDVALCGWNK